MKIVLITPAGARSRLGNRATANRWAGFLREAGHRVAVQTCWDRRTADLMIALHARKSHASISEFAMAFPERALVVVLTGTDLYRDIRTDEKARQSLRLATRLIVLQDQGGRELTPALRDKTRIIYQSTRPITAPKPLQRSFEICVSGHLREEKDPFRAALALRYLTDESRILVTHIGGALSASFADEAKQFMRSEPRYRWLGELPHWAARRILARARVLVISSRMEGGANVVTEALTARVPVIASRIPGNIGMLGSHYAGYFPLEDARALATLLERVEFDAGFYRLLQKQGSARRSLVTPARERAALKRLIAEFG
ncbi:MAG: TIGR04348 family glycosyltransferase [Burkholderiales bacterium]|nr:TIGR04348 family glycosyltransferase [Burkholderiales bacterium]